MVFLSRCSLIFFLFLHAISRAFLYGEAFEREGTLFFLLLQAVVPPSFFRDLLGGLRLLFLLYFVGMCMPDFSR